MQAAGEGDDVAGVDHVISIHGYFDHGAVGVEPQVAMAGAAEEEQTLAGKEALEALPFGIDIDLHAGGHVGGALEENLVGTGEVHVIHIAGAAGGDADFCRAALCRELVDEQAFPAEEPTEAAFHFGFHHHVGGHGCHG